LATTDPETTRAARAHATPRQQGIRQRSLRKHCRLGRATELVFVLATGAMVVIAGTSAQAQVDLQYSAGGGTPTAPVGGLGFFDNVGGNFRNGISGSHAPTAVDNVFFGGAIAGVTTPDTASGYNVIVGDSAAGSVTTTVNDLTVNVDGLFFADGVGGDLLEVDGVLRVASGNTLSLSVPIADTLVIGDGTAAYNGNVNMMRGVAGAVTQNTQNGVVAITSGTYGSTWTTDSGVTRISGLSTVSGGITVNAGGTLDVDRGLTGNVNSNGTLDVDVASGQSLTGNVTVAGGSASINGNLQGVLRMQANTTIDGAATVSGGVDIISGVLDVNEALSSDIRMTDGGVRLSDSLTGAVTIDGGIFGVDGNSTVSGAISVNGGTLQVNSTSINLYASDCRLGRHHRLLGGVHT